MTEAAGKARRLSCLRSREWFEKPPKKQQATALTSGSKFDNDGEMEEFTQNVETLADLNKPVMFVCVCFVFKNLETIR